MRISITLPSIYPQSMAEALNNIRSKSRTDPEVIIVSPHEPPPGAVWVPETEPKGCAAAHAVAAKHATGDLILPFADDHEFVDRWDEIAIDNFLQRERGTAFCLGLRGWHSGHVGTEFGIYYPYFPLIRRAVLPAVGGWLQGPYQRGFSDSDFALRVWQAGGVCEWSDRGLLYPATSDRRKYADGNARPGAAYTEQDMATFLERWTPVYGHGWDVSSIDRFNIDLRPEENQGLVWDYTIYQNRPAFADIVVRMS